MTAGKASGAADPSDGAVAAAVFDLGGVVLATDVAAAAEVWGRAVGIEPDRVLLPFGDDTGHHGLERGEISIEQYHAHVAAVLRRPLGLADFLTGWHAILQGLMPGIDELLARLQGRLRLAVLSNTNASHAERFLRVHAATMGRFERVFLSHQLGTRKPERRCFQAVLDYLHLPAGRVIFIDDHPANVAAAEGLGMRGVVAAGTEQIAEALAAMGV